MIEQQTDLADLFEQPLSFPNPEARTRLSLLIGIDDQRERLGALLSVLVNAAGLRAWFDKFHPESHPLMERVLRRPPLVVLAGDVGCGKTELATTIGDAVARQEGIDVTLLPLSLSARGAGRVGEMTRLISAAFEHTVSEARKLARDDGSTGAVILLVDEADALAQSRELAQMHHEDRAGVNAFIRGVDRLGMGDLPAAVIMCTNRLDSLDPAVRRRAAEVLEFGRPTEEQRMAILNPFLASLGFAADQIVGLIEATGPRGGEAAGFTYSDLTQRLLPALVLDAYPSGAIDPSRALRLASAMTPTPVFGG
jgi:SpoVK/Ycf46/Vps4 family AAA+-type ATPase